MALHGGHGAGAHFRAATTATVPNAKSCLSFEAPKTVADVKARLSPLPLMPPSSPSNRNRCHGIGQRQIDVAACPLTGLLSPSKSGVLGDANDPAPKETMV